MADHTPSARFRSSPSAKITVSRLRAAGAMNAEPNPWAAREPTSSAGELARPQERLAAAKTTMPEANTRRRP
jgi:hypothetical protein